LFPQGKRGADMKILTKFLTVIFILSITGCDIISPQKKPNCEIVKIEKRDAKFPDPAEFIVTVKNNGDADASYIQCQIELKNENTIVDRGYAFLGPLNPGESETEEASFTKITSHNQYQYYDLVLSWYDDDGGYYQK
jgi:hypothetical protein